MKIILKKLVTLGIISVFILNVTPPVFAESGLDPEIKQQVEERLAGASFAECQNVLVPAYDIELIEFLAFLDQNFINDSSNSSLLNIAIARYREFTDALEDKFEQLRPKREEFGFFADDEYVSAMAEFNNCGQIFLTYKDLAKEHMTQHIMNSTYQKKSVMLVDKYQAINFRVRALHFSIARLYAYFLTFRNKLPAFSDCVTQ